MAIHRSKKDQNNNNNEHDDDDNQRNRRTVVSLENFAHRKADGKAITAFRERKQKKRLHTAQALRKYQKVMHAEGYEPGKGASRRRIFTEDKRSSEQLLPKSSDEKDEPRKQRHDKTNPFSKDTRHAEKKESNMANNHSHQQQQNLDDQKAREKQRKKKLRERRQRTKMLRQKTSKGQPIMKNLVHDILDKLEKEKQLEGR